MAKHKYIETPEKMWELFEAYRKEIHENPRIKIDYVGRDGDRVETPITRPLTIEGFKVYCFNWGCDIQAYYNNRDNQYNEYSPIIARIRETIRQEQIEGGMTGFYNANLTARLNGLREQTETTNSHNVKLLNIDPLADDDSITEDSKPKE